MLGERFAEGQGMTSGQLRSTPEAAARVVSMVPLGRWGRVAAIVLTLGALGSPPALAQSATQAPAPATSDQGRGVWPFLGGAGVSFVTHELGHVLFDVAFDADPRVKKISFKGIPFFAIVHTAELSPRREYTVAASGLWIQNGLNEWILSRDAAIRRERAPFRKGVLAMGVLTSAVYAGAGLLRIGPPERDTRSMASSLKIDERWVGLMVLAPALLDVYRYLHPEAKWAAWSSRGVKVGLVLLVIK